MPRVSNRTDVCPAAHIGKTETSVCRQRRGGSTAASLRLQAVNDITAVCALRATGTAQNGAQQVCAGLIAASAIRPAAEGWRRTSGRDSYHRWTMLLASLVSTPKSLARPYSVLPYAREKLRILALRRSEPYSSLTSAMPSRQTSSILSAASSPALMRACGRARAPDAARGRPAGAPAARLRRLRSCTLGSAIARTLAWRRAETGAHKRAAYNYVFNHHRASHRFPNGRIMPEQNFARRSLAAATTRTETGVSAKQRAERPGHGGPQKQGQRGGVPGSRGTCPRRCASGSRRPS